MSSDDAAGKEKEADVKEWLNRRPAAKGDSQPAGVDALEATEKLMVVQHEVDDGIAKRENVINVTTGEAKLLEDEQGNVLSASMQICRCQTQQHGNIIDSEGPVVEVLEHGVGYSNDPGAPAYCVQLIRKQEEIGQVNSRVGAHGNSKDLPKDPIAKCNICV